MNGKDFLEDVRVSEHRNAIDRAERSLRSQRGFNSAMAVHSDRPSKTALWSEGMHVPPRVVSAGALPYARAVAAAVPLKPRIHGSVERGTLRTHVPEVVLTDGTSTVNENHMAKVRIRRALTGQRAMSSACPSPVITTVDHGDHKVRTLHSDIRAELFGKAILGKIR